MIAVDVKRFDDLACTLGAGASRRGMLSGLTGGLLAVVSLWRSGEDAAAKKRRKKNKKKKRCTPNCAGKACGDDGCGGSCGTCSVGKTCQGGTCLCPPGQEDSGGVCAPPPTCLGASALCGANAECCSAFCAGLLACASSEAGQPCHVTSDCQPGLNCVGFVCTA